MIKSGQGPSTEMMRGFSFVAILASRKPEKVVRIVRSNVESFLQSDAPSIQFAVVCLYSWSNSYRK